jgi:hypothetical protein
MSVAKLAKEIYETEYRANMERDHMGQFVAIEPQSKACFVAPTFIEAALAAKMSHPKRMSFVIKIGHEAAVHIGAASL